MSNEPRTGAKTMKTLEVFHPAGQWVEVLRTDNEQEMKAFLTRYVIDMGLRCRILNK